MIAIAKKMHCNCSGSWMFLTHKDKTTAHVEWDGMMASMP